MEHADRQHAESFSAGQFEKGLAQAVDAANSLLKAHFALSDGQANPTELPNRVDLRKASGRGPDRDDGRLATAHPARSALATRFGLR